jgi:hypothetical protein
MAKVAVKFEVYNGSESLEDLGTLKSIIGKGGTVKLSKKNFFNPEKRVVTIVTNKAGESAVISCSTGVSKHARQLQKDGKKQNEILGWLVGLNVLANEEGQYFVSMPGGEAGEGTSVDSLKVVETSAIINTEELIAW